MSQTLIGEEKSSVKVVVHDNVSIDKEVDFYDDHVPRDNKEVAFDDEVSSSDKELADSPTGDEPDTSVLMLYHLLTVLHSNPLKLT